MPRQQTVDPSDRAKVLYVRVSAATHDAVKGAAAHQGVTVGDWCRQVVEREVNRA